MYWYVFVGVKNSIDILVEGTAVHTIGFTCLESFHSRSGHIFFIVMVGGVTGNFGPFCSRDFSSVASSFLKRLMTHLSWKPEVVEEVAGVLKVLVVLEAILEVVVEALEIMCLSF